MLATAVTLVGLGLAILGSFLLFRNNANPRLMEETSDGDITFRYPNRVARESKLARNGFCLVLAGFVLQAVGVSLPLLSSLPMLSRFSMPTANNDIHTNIHAPLLPKPVTFASEARRGFYAITHLRPDAKASEIVETARSLQYTNLTSKDPSDGFTTGIYIGVVVRLNSFSTPQYSEEEVSGASKMADVYRTNVIIDQKYNGLTDQEMNGLVGDWAMDIVRDQSE